MSQSTLLNLARSWEGLRAPQSVKDILGFTIRMMHAWAVQVYSSVAVEVSCCWSAAETVRPASWDWLVQTLLAKCFSLHALQQSKFQAALPSKHLLLMRTLYLNPFLGKVHCEWNEVSFVKSYCGRARAVLLNPYLDNSLGIILCILISPWSLIYNMPVFTSLFSSCNTWYRVWHLE